MTDAEVLRPPQINDFVDARRAGFGTTSLASGATSALGGAAQGHACVTHGEYTRGGGPNQ